MSLLCHMSWVHRGKACKPFWRPLPPSSSHRERCLDEVGCSMQNRHTPCNKRLRIFFPKRTIKISPESNAKSCVGHLVTATILRNFHHEVTTCPHIFLSKCWRNVSGCVFWFIYFCFTFFATVKLDRPSLCVSWNTAAYQARPQCTSFWVCQVFFTTANFFLHL